jgi:hypothetical protein
MGNHAPIVCFANEDTLVELDTATTVSLDVSSPFCPILTLFAGQTKLKKRAVHKLKRALRAHSIIRPLPFDLRHILMALQWGHKGIKNVKFEME